MSMQDDMKYNPRLTPNEKRAKRILVETMREHWREARPFRLDDDFAIETLLRHGIRASCLSVDLTWLLLTARAQA